MRIHKADAHICVACKRSVHSPVACMGQTTRGSSGSSSRRPAAWHAVPAQAQSRARGLPTAGPRWCIPNGPAPSCCPMPARHPQLTQHLAVDAVVGGGLGGADQVCRFGAKGGGAQGVEGGSHGADDVCRVCVQGGGLCGGWASQPASQQGPSPESGPGPELEGPPAELPEEEAAAPAAPAAA